MPRIRYLDTEGGYHEALDGDELARVFESGEGWLWVDIDSRNDEEYQLLTDLFAFHPLAVEDVRSPACRVKFEEYDRSVLIVVRELRFTTESLEPYTLDTRNLYLFLGDHFLVTAHAGPSSPVDTLMERIETRPEVLGRGVDRLAYRILDVLVDDYFPLLDQIDDFVSDLEDAIFRSKEEVLVEQTFELKRSLLVLRRQLAPMREVAATMSNRPSAYLHPETQVYLRDVYDHLVRQLESVETYRELVSGALEMNLMVLSNRVNEVMKVLSVIATIVLPPTLVASIYGMNFDFLPGTGARYGFWFALLVMFLISAGFLIYVWRKRWL